MLSEDIVITGSRAMARSYAKINLTLDVIGKRSDGYHEVEMIMHTLSLFDLVITDKTKSGISIATNLRFLPNNEKNIAYLAAKKFFEYTGIHGGCKIIIHKNIPVAAGLAGGSGNAAAVLCSLNMLYNANLSVSELCDIGVTLGADVPYCIIGGTALASGIGEKLTPLKKPDKMTFLLVKPSISVSTASIYDAIDSADITEHPNTAAMIEAINSNNSDRIAQLLSNVMGTVTEKLHPIVKGIRNKMILNGAKNALMSGSGPTVFGIFPDYETAKKAHDSFAYQFKDVFIVNSK